MESLYTVSIFILLMFAIALPYWRRVIRQRKRAEEAHEKSARAGLLEPATLHPRIELASCIGCASCVQVCPEEVLGIVDGQAAIINGARCVGHSLCAEVCPVGAITMGFGMPKRGMEIPLYDENLETNIKGLYIVGELGGIGLIKNAFSQGTRAIDNIASNTPNSADGAYDVAIIGAGPAGIAAALAAQAYGLRHVVIEQYDLGGSVLHYPREKLVLTSPAELPLYGKLKFSEISKEELLSIFTTLVNRFGLNLRTNEKAESVTKVNDMYHVYSPKEVYKAAHVVLALGRRGSPRTLSVPGENLSKVFYRLIDAERYSHKRIVVVGGGNSAIEAALGLARQKGNDVTLSYRREAFVRLKERNEERIQQMSRAGKIRTIFNSEVTEIRQDSVLIRENGNVVHILANDFVFVFAGGELPSEFLKKAGVALRTAEFESKPA